MAALIAFVSLFCSRLIFCVCFTASLSAGSGYGPLKAHVFFVCFHFLKELQKRWTFSVKITFIFTMYLVSTVWNTFKREQTSTQAAPLLSLCCYWIWKTISSVTKTFFLQFQIPHVWYYPTFQAPFRCNKDMTTLNTCHGNWVHSWLHHPFSDEALARLGKTKPTSQMSNCISSSHPFLDWNIGGLAHLLC